MPMEAVGTLGSIVTIVAIICVYIFIMPERNYEKLNPFCKWLSDLFHFRTLWLEKILRFFYVLTTTACVVFGFFMLFGEESYGWGYSVSYTKPGLIILLVGPIVVRLVYEASMMFIILIKNVIEINKKMSDKAPAPQPVAPKVPAPQPAVQKKVFCANCGTPVSNGDLFCVNCGKKI